MRVLLVFLFLTGAAVAGNVGSPGTSNAHDEKPIKALVSNFVNAWNRHDAHAFAESFSEEANVNESPGEGVRGRDEIEHLQDQMFQTTLKNSQLTSTDVRTRFTAPHSAVVEVLWEMTGALEQNGRAIPLRRGILNWVVMGEGDDWQIVTMQNKEFSPSKECVNQGIDKRQLAPFVCWMQRTFSWKSHSEPHFLLIGRSKGPNIGLAWPPYMVVNLPARHRRWHMFRMGFRYDRTWRGYIFPAMAAKSIAHPLRY